MSLMLLIIVVALVVVAGGVLLVVVLAAANSRKDPAPPMGYAPPMGHLPPAGQDAPAVGYGPYKARAGVLSASALAEVRALLAQGSKIQAIKLVRRETRMGLKDAKDYVDAMVAGRPVGGPAGAVPWGPQPGGGLLSERARAFKAAGDQASAVALVRAETGMSQREAERFVDALD